MSSALRRAAALVLGAGLALGLAGVPADAHAQAAPEAKAEAAPEADAEAEDEADAEAEDEAAVDPELQPVLDCMRRNVPKRGSEQTVEFTAVDRLEQQAVKRARLYGKRFDDGQRRIKMCLERPEEVRGAQLLMIETDSRPDTFLYTPEMRKTKRITGSGACGSVFGTDFNCEDFARWQQLDQPGRARRLDDGVVSDRKAWMIETTPDAEAESQYDRVVTAVDQEHCVALRTESFQHGRLRKVLTVDPDQIFDYEGVRVATRLRMDDLFDQTYTLVQVDDVEVDVKLADRMFMESRLGRKCR